MCPHAWRKEGGCPLHMPYAQPIYDDLEHDSPNEHTTWNAWVGDLARANISNPFRDFELVSSAFPACSSQVPPSWRTY